MGRVHKSRFYEIYAKFALKQIQAHVKNRHEHFLEILEQKRLAEELKNSLESPSPSLKVLPNLNEKELDETTENCHGRIILDDREGIKGKTVCAQL